MKKVHTKFANLLLILSLLFASFFSTISTSHPVFADPIPSNAAPSTNPDQTTPDNTSGDQETNTPDPNATNSNPGVTTPGVNTTDSSTSTDATSTDNQEPVTCTSQIGAVGWIICPTTGLLAKGIDALYGVIENLLSVKPLEMGRNSPVYQVWAYMRNLANICFIIFLLVIIYSQITGLGINNYGIKKSLPRLIITAIIVNFSFLFCAIAVDISNIIGNGLKDLLAGIADNAISTGTIDPSKNTVFYARCWWYRCNHFTRLPRWSSRTPPRHYSCHYRWHHLSRHRSPCSRSTSSPSCFSCCSFSSRLRPLYSS